MTGVDILPADMRLALQQFDKDAEQITASFVTPLGESPPPDVIYHYTNDLGLRGILETGQLWLTDIFNLNDPSELRHGFAQVVNILNDRAKDGPPETRLFAQQVETFLTQGGIQASAHYFVLSFSGARDDLGQWRSYADNGRGYALGFDTRSLEMAFTRDGDVLRPNNSTFPIAYDDLKVADLPRQFVEKVFPLISLPRGRKLGRDSIHEFMGELFVLFAMHALRAVLFFKHEAYANEKEFRFLQIHRGDISAPDAKFRNRPYSLVRYREFEWRDAASEALREIVIGPAADREKAAQFARDCLRSFHGKVIEPTYSNIPYRAT